MGSRSGGWVAVVTCGKGSCMAGGICKSLWVGLCLCAGWWVSSFQALPPPAAFLNHCPVLRRPWGPRAGRILAGRTLILFSYREAKCLLGQVALFLAPEGGSQLV